MPDSLFLLNQIGLALIWLTPSLTVLAASDDPCLGPLSNVSQADSQIAGSENLIQSKSFPSLLATKIRATSSHPNVRVVTQEEHEAFLNSELRDPFLVAVLESKKAKIFDFSQRVSVPGLTQCRGTFLFNHDTKKFLVLHSSVYELDRTYALEIASLGKGRMSAIIIGPYSQEAPYLSELGITTQIISVPDARRMTVVYEPSRNTLEFSYSFSKPPEPGKYFLGSFSAFDNSK